MNRIQLVAAGEFPLLLAYTHTIERSKTKGAPIDWVNLEPVVLKIDSVMLGAHARHLNAGRLFIDYLLSQEGLVFYCLPERSRGTSRTCRESLVVNRPVALITSSTAAFDSVTNILKKPLAGQLASDASFFG